MFFSSPLLSSCVTSDPCNPTSLSSTRGSSALALRPRWELLGRLFSWLCDVFRGCSTPSHLTAFLLELGDSVGTSLPLYQYPITKKHISQNELVAVHLLEASSKKRFQRKKNMRSSKRGSEI